MSDKITTIESLARFVPQLRRLLEDAGILLVLDNLETLLTPAGTWRDPRWEPLMAALTGDGGESRVILTSRIPPAGLGSAVLRLPVHALDLAESAALARELPGLRGLLHADAGPVRDPGEAAVSATPQRWPSGSGSSAWISTPPCWPANRPAGPVPMRSSASVSTTPGR